MNHKVMQVGVTIAPETEVAKAIAMSELEAIYSSSGASLKLQKLEEDGINVETLTRYFLECAAIQAAFCEQKREFNSTALKDLDFKFSEVKDLYLPVLSATILSQMGDVSVGPYNIQVCANAEFKVDRTWVIQFSEALYRNQSIILCQKDQIGVMNRAATPDMMCSIVTSMSTVDKVIQVNTMVGASPDDRCGAFAALMGITLVNKAHDVLYPFESYIEYGRPGRIVATSNTA